MYYTIKNILIFCLTVVWKRENTLIYLHECEILYLYKALIWLVWLCADMYLEICVNIDLYLLFLCKKIHISIYLYFFYYQFILWTIKISRETSVLPLSYIHVCSRVYSTFMKKFPHCILKLPPQKVLMYSIERGLFSKFILCEFINLCSGGRGVSNTPPPPYLLDPRRTL